LINCLQKLLAFRLCAIEAPSQLLDLATLPLKKRDMMEIGSPLWVNGLTAFLVSVAIPSENVVIVVVKIIMDIRKALRNYAQSVPETTISR
jgi:hypothetical protein